MPRPHLPIAAVALGLLVAAAPASAQEEQPAPLMPTTAPTILSPDRVIVQWTPGADHGDKVEARGEADVAFEDDLGNRDFQLVEVEPGQTASAAVGELEANPAVAVAERDGYRSLDAVPNDPLFNQLWGLRNLGTGIDGFSGAVADYDVNAVTAWDRTIGSPTVVVADIDSGYRFEHPDLATVAWNNPGETANGLDDDGNGIVDDLHGADFIGTNGEVPTTDGDPTDDDLLSGGHGVHTAGTIGAAGNNGVGITGVAQNVRIMPLRVCSRYPNLGDGRCAFSSIVSAINYAGAKGARVANMSLGGNTFTQTEVNAIAANPGVLYVISAGNNGSDNDGAGSAPQGHHYPCDYQPTIDASPAVPGAIDNIVCVAATDQADGLAGFSDWGATSVDIGAPGTETLSTYPFVTPISDKFSINDFAAKWLATGVDGDFERTGEAPLTSFGMTDVVGAPAAETVRETTSAAVTVPANGGCRLTQDRRVVLAGGGHYRYSVLLNGSELAISEPGNTPKPGMERRFLDLPAAFKAGGSVQVRFRFTTGSAPVDSSGVWLDNIVFSCAQAVGQASAYAYLQGTSMAAPHVSGAAGLLFSSKPAATVTQVRSALLTGVDAIPSLTGMVTTGGRLDIPKALDSLEGKAVDNVAPSKPILPDPVPGSGTNNNSPRIKGSAEAGSTVALFKGFSCAGKPVATGTAAELAGAGIGVSVPDNTITFFTASATDAARNRSVCSAVTSYLEDSPPPEEGGGTGGGGGGGVVVIPPPSAPILSPPPPLICKVPKLVGLSPAQANSALAVAHCKRGKITLPKAKKGQKLGALVVKSSSPAAGATAPAAVNLTFGPKPKKARR
ncbi:MAG TPA: S8 family serine peptidase [Solirubrobacterales bacterium]|nr:S8 family serine peptidase [Solirubrobacterales bacterium]